MTKHVAACVDCFSDRGSTPLTSTSIPVESLAHNTRPSTTNALQKSSHQGDCVPFLAFILWVIHETVETTAPESNVS